MTQMNSVLIEDYFHPHEFEVDDVCLVTEQTRCSKRTAIEALRLTGDVVEAILHIAPSNVQPP